MKATRETIWAAAFGLLIGLVWALGFATAAALAACAW